MAQPYPHKKNFFIRKNNKSLLKKICCLHSGVGGGSNHPRLSIQNIIRGLVGMGLERGVFRVDKLFCLLIIA